MSDEQKQFFRNVMERTVAPTIIVGVLAGAGLFIDACCGINNSDTKRENEKHFNDWQHALDIRQVEMDNHYKDWEAALVKRQAAIDEKEQQEKLREMLRKLSTEELRARGQ